MLSTPIKFATSPATMPNRIASKEKFQPPAYIQVFHENGDLRQCDPLPMYTRYPVPTDDNISVTLPTETAQNAYDPHDDFNGGFESSSSSSSDDVASEDSACSYEGSLPQTRSSSPENVEALIPPAAPLDMEGLSMIQRQEISERQEQENIEEVERILDPIRDQAAAAVVRTNVAASSSSARVGSSDIVSSAFRRSERWNDVRRRLINATSTSTAISATASIISNNSGMSDSSGSFEHHRDAANASLSRNREMMRMAAEVQREIREQLEREGKQKVRAVLQSW